MAETTPAAPANDLAGGVPEAPVPAQAAPPPHHATGGGGDHDLPHLGSGPWDMFLSADIVVQVVMVLLAVASVVTWTILLAKGVEVILARRRLAAALRAARGDGGIDALRNDASAHIARSFLAAAEDERRLSTGLPVEGVKDRIALRLRRVEHGVVRRMSRGTGVLASIGSCAPFVGLFGTVWGIMNSFIGISRARSTSLAVVAPGIAEALLATAFGLAAAIPAVLTYNAFARALAGYRAQLSDLSAIVLAHAARELDRAQATQRLPAHLMPVRAAAE